MRIDVRKLRMDLGISQAEMAKRLGCAQPNICNMENNEYRNMSHVTVQKLCDTFGKKKVMSYQLPDLSLKKRRRRQGIVPASSIDTAYLLGLLMEQQRKTNEIIKLQQELINTLTKSLSDKE